VQNITAFESESSFECHEVLRVSSQKDQAGLTLSMP